MKDRYIVVGGVCLMMLFAVVWYFSEDPARRPHVIETSTSVVLAFTLIVLIIYAADTHTIARASEASLAHIVSNQKKLDIKQKIWHALEQKGTTPPALTITELADALSVTPSEISSVISEMVEVKLIWEGPQRGTFTRYDLTCPM